MEGERRGSGSRAGFVRKACGPPRPVVDVLPEGRWWSTLSAQEPAGAVQSSAAVRAAARPSLPGVSLRQTSLGHSARAILRSRKLGCRACGKSWHGPENRSDAMGGPC